MAKHDAGAEIKRDEFSKIFDEYRAKIEEITRRSEKSFQLNEIKPAKNHSDEEEHIEVISAPPLPLTDAKVNVQAQLEKVFLPAATPAPKPEVVENKIETIAESAPALKIEPAFKSDNDNGTNGKRPLFKESEEIIDQARREAKKIIEEAEESEKKEAKKRTQSQVDKILDKAKKESEEIIARANKSAEKVRDDVITESKHEADLIIREITQKYRQETEAKSNQAMADAQEKAAKMLADISATTMHVSKHITEIVHKARQTTTELETNLQAEVAELARIIGETQSKLAEVSKTTREEKYEAPPPPKQTAPRQMDFISTNPTLAIKLIGEKSPSNNGTSALFSGQMEMKSASESFDYQYLKKLKKHLVHIPKIKYLQEYASEKEMSVVFDILEPLPLLDILNSLPMVEQVVTRTDDDICLVFKTIEE